jgi:polyhydroxyalkanoate synthesis regulator phasin
MTEQKINEALDELRKQGEEIDNPESKELLSNLVDSIEQNVDYTGSLEDHQDLIEDVKDAITHFEVEHPHITGVLTEIMMALSNCGI